ncbi:hypothetical protein LAT59_02175 [Candidatus Gracilibacteria bacterium]|nr:hypothetical protein [Candidatus Gracilibacteria bacterium]
MKYIKISLILAFAYIIIAKVGAVEVKVTERVPGANCGGADGDGVITCHIPTGFGAVSGVFGEMIKYFTFIALLGAVLFIVINGIMYSMAGLNDGLKSAAKDRIMKTLIGLILLLMSGWILNTLAPWVYR